MGEEIRGHCWHCGQGLTKLDYGREARCRACDKPTHSCRNCRHHAPGRPNECREPLVERIIDKERGNFCEWFEPALRGATTHGRQDACSEEGAALRRAAEDLFKP